MWEGQGGVCAICKGTNKSGIALSVDHDHKTGEVRELLCGNCNGKLGWFEMYSPEVLNYLARNNKPQQKLSLVVVDPELWEDGKEKFEELIEKGHTVRFLDFSGFDGVLGEQASRFNKHLLPRLPVLISEIRKRRKAKNANPRHG